MKVVDLKGYMCDKCGKIYTDKYMAEICCKQYYCEECGSKVITDGDYEASAWHYEN